MAFAPILISKEYSKSLSFVFKKLLHLCYLFPFQKPHNSFFEYLFGVVSGDSSLELTALDPAHFVWAGTFDVCFVIVLILVGNKHDKYIFSG